MPADFPYTGLLTDLRQVVDYSMTGERLFVEAEEYETRFLPAEIEHIAHIRAYGYMPLTITLRRDEGLFVMRPRMPYRYTSILPIYRFPLQAP